MKLRTFGCAVLLALVVIVPNFAQQSAPARQPDVIFVPTPADVVNAMLRLANVTAADTVYDLGSGDGRIVITAAKMYGAHGVGIDIDPERTREATAGASQPRTCCPTRCPRERPIVCTACRCASC